MAAGSQWRKSFAFVPVNADRSDAASQKLIRAHAMHEALRQKVTGSELSGPTKPILYRTGRFRLSTSPAKGRARPKSENASQSSASLSLVSIMEELDDGARRNLTLHYAPFLKQGLPTTPSPGKLDPFESLPIMFGSQQQMLLSYYDSSFTQNDIAFNGNRRMLSIASSDPAWLHATFALIALSHGFVTGIASGLSQECLFNRGQALQIIRQRVHDSPTAVVDATIGTIASLANIEMMTGSFVTCTAHMKGLRHLLSLRGWNSLRDIPEQASFLRRLVAWSDLAYAGVMLSVPYFLPIEPVFQTSTSLVDTLWDERMLAPVQPQLVMTEILDDLRVLSHILDTRCPNDKERAYFSAAIFNTQYKLTTFTGNNTFVERQSYNLETSRTFLSLSYRNATSISLCLYINMVLRKLPLGAGLHYAMAMHVKSDLEKSGDQLLLTWAPNLKFLLWILFIGAVATIGRVEREYFINCMELVVMELRLRNLESFVKILHLTVWSEGLCFPQSKVLWMEMSGSSLVRQDFIDSPNS